MIIDNNVLLNPNYQGKFRLVGRHPRTGRNIVVARCTTNPEFQQTIEECVIKFGFSSEERNAFFRSITIFPVDDNCGEIKNPGFQQTIQLSRLDMFFKIMDGKETDQS